MTNILSSISGQFSKSLILGTFLPVIVFVLLFRILVAPFFPYDLPLLAPLETLDTEWQVIAISLLAIVLSGMLYNLNIPIIRFYEGYPWKDTWIGKRRVQRYQEQFNAAVARWRGMRTLLDAMDDSLPGDKRNPQIETYWNKIARGVNTEFPKDATSVLPTRLGNVIRSFENYPKRQYGIDAITLWTRLIAKVDKDYAAAIGDAKTSFDFMVNCSMLSAVLSLALLITGLLDPTLFYPTMWASGRIWLLWLVEILVFAASAYLFYLGSLGRAGAWGALVKGAFDLYRWDLLKQLGYTRMPSTMVEERALWDDISKQLVFGDSPEVRLPEYGGTSATARSYPPVVDLEVARGISPPALNAGGGRATRDAGAPAASVGDMQVMRDANAPALSAGGVQVVRDTSAPATDGAVTITLSVLYVEYAGAEERYARDVVVTDTVPDGFDYEWNSAHIDNRAVRVVGANPYQFYIGDLCLGSSVILTYRVLPREK